MLQLKGENLYCYHQPKVKFEMWTKGWRMKEKYNGFRFYFAFRYLWVVLVNTRSIRAYKTDVWLWSVKLLILFLTCGLGFNVSIAVQYWVLQNNEFFDF